MIPRMTRNLMMRAVLACAVISVLSCAPMRGKYTLNLPEYHEKMPSNGLRVILLPDPSTPLVEVDVRYEVGANEDPAGMTGMAHLVEHMMFQQRPAGEDKPELFKVLRQVDVFFNAYTSWDKTHYMNLVRKEDLETILAIEAARMHLGCKTISDEQFQREREVVRNEFRQNYGDPSSILLYKWLEAAYPAGHPYSHLPIGTDEDLSRITMADVCKFMADYYIPERATLVIAGNVTPEEVAPLVNKYFAGINDGSEEPKRVAAPRKTVTPIELKKRRVDLELDIEEPTVTLMWRLPARFSEDDAAAQQMIGVVTALVSQEGDEWDFVTDVQPTTLGGEMAPVFALVITLRSEEDIGKAIDAGQRAAKRAYRFVADPNTDLRDSAARVKARYVMSFEQLMARTNLFADYEQFAPDQGFFAGELRRIDNVDLGRIKSYLKRELDPDNALIVIARPRKGAERGGKKAKLRFNAASTDNRSDGLVDPAEARMKLPVPEKVETTLPGKTFTMGNGMKVILQPTRQALPVMSVRLVFNAGSVHESPGKAGLAQIAGTGLNPPQSGTGLGGEISFESPLARIGASTGVNVGADTTVFSVTGLNIYDEILIKGLERWIKAGDYDQDQIENYRKYLGFAFKRKSYRAQDNYQRAIAAAVYGEDHPYTVTGSPTQKSIGSIGRDAAYDFKSTHFTAKNATLIVAGNFDVGAVEGYVRDNFGDWGGGHQDKPVAAVLPARDKLIVVGVENQEELSTQVSISYPIGATVDGQYGARQILAEMLNDRMSVIREQLGSSYGTYARLRTALGPGAYTLGGGIDADRCGVSLAAMRKGVDSLRVPEVEAGAQPTDEQRQQREDFDASFAKSRRGVLRRLLTDSGTSGEVASRLLFIAVYGLTDGFYDKLTRQVAAATPAQVHALVASELVPQREVIVILGTRAQVDKCLAENNLTMTKWVPLEEEKK
jgi:predicted Zn-dependent peptidase